MRNTIFTILLLIVVLAFTYVLLYPSNELIKFTVISILVTMIVGMPIYIYRVYKYVNYKTEILSSSVLTIIKDGSNAEILIDKQVAKLRDNILRYTCPLQIGDPVRYFQHHATGAVTNELAVIANVINNVYTIQLYNNSLERANRNELYLVGTNNYSDTIITAFKHSN